MKIEIEYPKKAKADNLFEWIKDRANHKDHKANRDLIADFVDKFVIFEMKRLANSTETYMEKVELPDELLREIKTKAGKVPDNQGVANQTPTSPATAPAKPKSRNGNGHKKLKKRELADQEKDGIRTAFLAIDGVADNDHWVEYKKGMDQDISIAQVTGFVSYLHTQVAMGRLCMADTIRYIDHIQHRHDLWSTYNSPKYKAMRETQSAPASPKFASGFPRRGQ